MESVCRKLSVVEGVTGSREGLKTALITEFAPDGERRVDTFLLYGPDFDPVEAATSRFEQLLLSMLDR